MTDKTIAPNAPYTNRDGVRVSLPLLDTLMNLAGELVLSRNQLLQMVNEEDLKGISASSQRIDLITSELQDAIMNIRMQSVDDLLNGLAQQAGQWDRVHENGLEFHIRGNHVELDKSIIEALRLPLEGLLRHMIEWGDAVGRGTPGSAISLAAEQDAGQVYITLTDEKSVLSPAPRLDSTDITDRIEALGGSLDIRSDADTGTRIRIKLPLTLAIIPSQIASVGPERYALPQANLDELLRIPAAQVKERIEKVGDAAVVRLRGELLPVLDLAGLLGIHRQYPGPDTGEFLPDRRENIADRRSKQLMQREKDGLVPPADEDERRAEAGRDRRRHSNSATHIAVVSTGAYRYGLVVDRFLDVEEIVVKSLGRHMRSCTAYAGATIMGNGSVALILDIASLATHARLSETLNRLSGMPTAQDETGTEKNADEAMILFRNREEEYFCAPQQYVDRIERIRSDQIEALGSKKVVQHQGRALPLHTLNEVADVDTPPQRDTQEILVIKAAGKEFGLMVTPPVDTVDRIAALDESALKGRAVKGSTIVNGRTTLVLDMEALIEMIS